MEVDRITRYTDSKVRICVGVLVGGDKRLLVENIYIEVVCLVRKVSAKYANKVRYSLVVGFSERLGYYREGI